MLEADHLPTVRTAYDTVAEDDARLLRTDLDNRTLDQAMLAAFAELIPPGGLVAEVGCGPGRITAHLAALGLDVFGVDLSPAMIAVARAEHRDLRFHVGDLGGLEQPDGALSGVVAWYAIIHTPPDQLSDVFAELRRVIATDGHLLLAFQVGDQRVHLQQAYGHLITLDAYRLPVAFVVDRLAAAGFEVVVELVRQPDAREKTPQAFLLATRSAAAESG